MTQVPEDQAAPPSAAGPAGGPAVGSAGSPAVGSAKVPEASPAPSGKAGGTVYGSPQSPAGRAVVPGSTPAGTTPGSTMPAITTPGSAPPAITTPGSPAPGGTAPGGATLGGAARGGVPGTVVAGKARKRRLLPALLAAFVALLALAGAGAALQLTRDLPEATLSTTIDATMRIPGEAPDLPWPGDGTAELMIEGLGRLGGSGKDTAAPIGSVAKVMTAYVILQEHPLSGNQEGPSLTVTAADVADFRSRIATNQSLVPVKEGTKLTERDALEALMLPSANNVAHQLAVWDAGSESAFVAKMNAAADELGMADTEYTDPSGFLPTTVSTAADQVILGRAAVKNPVFAEIVELESATIPVAGKISNYNYLLGEAGVFGIKTGSTDEAGGNLLFASRVKVGSRTLILVGAVFNQPGADTPAQLANVNRVVRKLLTTVRKVVKEYELLAAAPAGRVETAWGASASVSPADPLKVVGWPGLEVPVKIKDTGSGDAISAGEVVGTVEASGVRVQLRADAAVAEPSLWWRLTRRP